MSRGPYRKDRPPKLRRHPGTCPTCGTENPMVAGNEDVCYNCWRAGKWVPLDEAVPMSRGHYRLASTNRLIDHDREFFAAGHPDAR